MGCDTCIMSADCIISLIFLFALVTAIWWDINHPSSPIWPHCIESQGEYRIAAVTRGNKTLYYPEYRAHSWAGWRRIAGDSDPFMTYYLVFESSIQANEWVAKSRAERGVKTTTYIIP